MRDVAIMVAVYDARTRAHLSRCLADAFLAGVWNERALADRAGRALDRRPRWVRQIAREALVAYPRQPDDRPRELARFIDIALQRRPLPAVAPKPPRVRRWLLPEARMGRRRWPVPEIATVGDLGSFLELSTGDLSWFADARGLERAVADDRLRHYRYATLTRPGRPARVIERPKRRLKQAQRRILHEILDWIPAHDAAHGFTRGRSVRTHAREHTGQDVIVRLDLEDFFASIGAGRIFGIFRTAAYPEAVAHSLTALTTNTIPHAVWAALPRPTNPAAIYAHHHLGRRLATPHLPQGAPTSPALANLAAFGLDRRLTGLAASLSITYTRYADDLTFSGPARLINAFGTLRRAVADIAREEGFVVNPNKTMLVTRAGQQRVCGVVVNDHLNAPRAEYDRLKAIIHNARVHGPASQNHHQLPNFREHLLGRVAWIDSLNPQRGHKLRSEFARINWGETE